MKGLGPCCIAQILGGKETEIKTGLPKCQPQGLQVLPPTEAGPRTLNK